MKIAIDIDGTITRYPELFRDMLNRYPEAVILTGYAGQDWRGRKQDVLVQQRQAQLLPILGVVSHRIVVCTGATVADVAKAKGEFCRDNAITAIIDDSGVYCRAVRAISPTTAVLQVVP
jgi:hypothetical protein